MDEYLYIIVGIAAVIFNIYKSANKRKKQQEAMAEAQSQQEDEHNEYQEPEYQKKSPRDIFQHENFPTDVMGEFDKIFGNTTKQVEKEEYNVEETIIPNLKIETEEKKIYIPKKEKDISIKNKPAHAQSHTKSRMQTINIKQAIIYKAILERKY